MGLIDRARGIGKEGLQRAKEQAASAGERVAAKDPERYEQATELARRAGRGAKQAGASVAGLGSLVVQACGETETGARIGDRARRLTRGMATLPGVTLATDVIGERHGLSAVMARLVEAPDDPLRSLNLAEVLMAVEHDRRIYSAARSVIDPTQLVTRALIQGVTGMAAEDQASPSEHLLKCAMLLSVEALKRDPGDAAAVEVLTRIQLIRGDHRAALRYAKLAIDTSPPDRRGSPLVTLARVYQVVGDTASAIAASELALRGGHSLGLQVIADIRFRQAEREQRQAEYVQLVGRIRGADRVAYFGFDFDARTFAKAVAAGQTRKAHDTFRTVKAASKRVLPGRRPPEPIAGPDSTEGNS
ncbi:tetratricopeptide repeat protein [Streptomyces sp. NPDC090445]|uniref:tetratricopeptide repeat protein n=1 Tax=Streptomyces sp. NPDC090445 TaxID=3365963 RepID=UPI003821AB20